MSDYPPGQNIALQPLRVDSRTINGGRKSAPRIGEAWGIDMTISRQKRSYLPDSVRMVTARSVGKEIVDA